MCSEEEPFLSPSHKIALCLRSLKKGVSEKSYNGFLDVPTACLSSTKATIPSCFFVRLKVGGRLRWIVTKHNKRKEATEKDSFLIGTVFLNTSFSHIVVMIITVYVYIILTAYKLDDCCDDEHRSKKTK